MAQVEKTMQVLEKHEDEFFDVVDAKLKLRWLKRKKVISENLMSQIENTDGENAKEILFDHLHRNADVAALREYCKMAITADAFPKMQKLGEKMLSELPTEGAGQACGQTTSQAGAQDDTTLLGKKPSLMLLRNIVVPKVSANWMTVVVNLDIKDSRLSAIEKSKPHQTDACCTEMFSIWLGQAPWHTGGLPLTWSSVLSAIEKVDSVTSKELLAELKSIVEAHPATLQLAGELEAFYNRLEPVVRDSFTPELEFVELAVVERQKKEGLRKKKNLEEFLHAQQ